MNKLFTKIAALSLGLSMAIGVGVAVGVKANEPIGVEAAETVVGDTFALITSTDDLVAGKSYLIGCSSAGTVLSTTQNNNNRGYVSTTISDGVITFAEGMQEITLRGSTDAWVLGVSETQGLIGVNNQNYLRTGEDTWKISITSSGEATMASNTSKRVIKFNNGTTKVYGTYASGQTAVQLYLKEEGCVTFKYPGGSTTNMTGGNDAAKFGRSASDWSVVGYKNGNTNFPGLNTNGSIRLYGNNQNYIVFKTLAASGTRYLNKVIVSASANNFSLYKGEANFTTAIDSSGSNPYTYELGEDAIAFTILNTSSTQSQIQSIKVQYSDVEVTTPTLVLNNAPTAVGLESEVDFTIDYFNLTSAFSVTTDSTYVTASYTGATGTGTATITLSGVARTDSTTITVSSEGAVSQSFDVEVTELPLFESEIKSLVWIASNPTESAAYAKSPWTLTMNSKYEFVVSTGQDGYMGSNSGNSQYINVSSDSWKLKGTSIATALDGNWSTYGTALYMSNFGIVNPTEFSVSVTTTNASATATKNVFILASEDSGDSWSVVTSTTLSTESPMSWSGDKTGKTVQFAFVYTSSAVNTISGITVTAYGSSMVTTKVLDSIYISGTPKTTYVAGESFDLEEAVVKAHYTDSVTYPDEDVTEYVSFSTISHGTTEVTISYMGKSVSVNVTVTDAGDVYKKITSASELLDGSKVVIGTTNSNNLMGAQNTNNRISESAHEYGHYDSGDVETYSINTAEFTVGIVEENGNTYYTFKDSDDKYLYAVASSNNYLRSYDTLTSAGKWSITFGENGSLQITTIVNYAIEEVATDVTKYMGGSASAFGCYTTENNLSVFVDVSTNVTLFGDTYMHMSDYSSQQGWCKDSEHHYYVTAKAALISMGTDYIEELQYHDIHSAILARYIAWASACHDTTPFEGDGIVLSQNSKAIMNGILNNDESLIIVIITISLVSLSGIAFYVYTRKRKEIK